MKKELNNNLDEVAVVTSKNYVPEYLRISYVSTYVLTYVLRLTYQKVLKISPQYLKYNLKLPQILKKRVFLTAAAAAAVVVVR